MISFDMINHHEIIYLFTFLVSLVVLLLFLRHQRYHQWVRLLFVMFVAISSLYNFQSEEKFPTLSLAFAFGGIVIILKHYIEKRDTKKHLDQMYSKIRIFRYSNLESITINEDVVIEEFNTKLIHKDHESMVFITVLEPEKRYEMYCSDFDKKFTVLKGSIQLFVNGAEYDIEKGDNVNIIKYDNHYYIVSKEGCTLRVDCKKP